MQTRPEQVFSTRASFYARSVVHGDPELLARMISLCAPRPGQVALDVGAGTLHTAMAIAPHVECVVCLDMTREMLLQGNRMAIDRGIRNLHLCLGDAAAVPLAQGTIDVITCRRAAHHFTDLPLALREMHRVLKPSGVIILDDRTVPESPRTGEFINALDRMHDPSHVLERPPSEWQELLQGTGFRVDDVRTYRRNRTFSSYTEAVELERKALMLDHLRMADLATTTEIDLDLNGPDPSWDHFFLTIKATRV